MQTLLLHDAREADVKFGIRKEDAASRIIETHLQKNQIAQTATTPAKNFHHNKKRRISQPAKQVSIAGFFKPKVTLAGFFKPRQTKASVITRGTAAETDSSSSGKDICCVMTQKIKFIFPQKLENY